MTTRLTKAEASEMLRKIGERCPVDAVQSALPRRASEYRDMGETSPCPECGRPARIRPRSMFFWLAVILFFPIGLLFLLEPRVCECDRCALRFKCGGLKLW